MNRDDELLQSLYALRDPLPAELSVATRVLQQLNTARAIAPPEPATSRWAVRATVLAVACLAATLLCLVKPGPLVTLAEVQAAVERQNWVRMVYDDGSETWVCLANGTLFRKTVHVSRPTMYLMRDPVTRTEQHYDGQQQIRRFSPNVWVLGRQRNGKVIPLEVDELTFREEDFVLKPEPGDQSGVMPPRVFEIVIEDGRRLGHFSRYRRDALNQLHVVEELWVDLQTRLPVRIRTWGLADEGGEHVARDGRFSFEKTGPQSLYDLGVPRSIPIIPQVTSLEEARRLIPAATWQAIEGAQQAARRFPRQFRVLAAHDDTRLTLTYVDSGEEPPFEWSIDPPGATSIGRYFEADCLNQPDVSAEYGPLAAMAAFQLAVPSAADAIADAFPIAAATNTRLVDGRRWFVLTRSPGRTPPLRLQILTPSSSHEIRELRNQWEYADWNWTELATGTSMRTAPDGQILIHAERADLKNDWFVDPQRNFAVVHKVEARLIDGRWREQETRAVHWLRLPDVGWYVSAWETRRLDLEPAANARAHTDTETVTIDRTRLVVTPLKPADVPQGVFDGDQFLESCKGAGAELRVN